MRRYTSLKASRGTVIPTWMRSTVQVRDHGCVGPRVGMPGECEGALELDHVRASFGMGLKSQTEPSNLVTLCSTHHRLKTEHGRDWRPKLLDYLEGA